MHHPYKLKNRIHISKAHRDHLRKWENQNITKIEQFKAKND
jgi:hypothetical protein